MQLPIFARTTFSQILLIILAIVSVALIVFYIVIKEFEHKNYARIKSLSNGTRIYVIDYKKNTVLFFDRAKLRIQKEVSFDMFLDQFLDLERDRVKQWIENLLIAKSDTPKFLEADVHINKDKRVFFSFLQVQKIDIKNKIIHIDSYIMKYLVSKNNVLKKGKRPIVTSVQMQEILSTSKYKNRGAVFVVRFFHTRIQANPTRQVENLLLAQLRNNINHYLNSNRYMVDLSDATIAIFDLKLSSRRIALQFAHSLRKELSRFVDLNSLHETYSFSIGICEMSKTDGSFKELIKKAKATSIVADTHHDNIALYDDEAQIEKSSVASFETEINNIIKNKELKYFFRPVVNAKIGQIYGYYSYIKSLNNVFTSIQEIKEFSYKIGQGKELFGLISKSIIPKFINERDGSDLRLFYSISIMEYKFIAKSLSHIAGIKDLKLSFVFDEEELYNWQHDNGEIEDAIESLRQRGHEVVLCLKNKNLLLTKLIIQLFDCFIIDGTLSRGVKRNSRMRLTVHSLVEKLEQFNRPIIVMDMETWNGVEIMTRLGIDLISSDVISEYDEMILPVDKKKMAKLKGLITTNRN